MPQAMFCAQCGAPRADATSPCSNCGRPGPAAAPAGMPPYAATGAPGSVPGYASSVPYGAPSPYGPPMGGVTSDGLVPKGFLKSLYDFKFDSLVTPKLIRFFYALFVILASIGAGLLFLVYLVLGFRYPIFIAVAILVVPIVYLMQIIWLRVVFELIAAFFRLVDDVRSIRLSKP